MEEALWFKQNKQTNKQTNKKNCSVLGLQEYSLCLIEISHKILNYQIFLKIGESRNIKSALPLGIGWLELSSSYSFWKRRSLCSPVRPYPQHALLCHSVHFTHLHFLPGPWQHLNLQYLEGGGIHYLGENVAFWTVSGPESFSLCVCPTAFSTYPKTKLLLQIGTNI